MIYLITFILSLGLTFVLVHYQTKLNFYAHTDHRTLHKKATPNSGGIAIFIAVFTTIALSPANVSIQLYIAFILIFTIGLYDDRVGASSRQKILFLFIISNVLFFSGFQLNYLGTFWGYEVIIDGVWAYLFLSFAIVGFVNAVNLIDGLDGLAAVIGIIILSSFLYIGYKYKNDFMIYLPLIYILALIGFLIFNWNPAKIFMGDSGSLTLGLFIAIIAIYGANKQYFSPISILLLAALPILDTFIVMTRRIRNGLSPFSPDRNHIHHIILKQQRGNVKRTVAILALFQLTMTYIGLGFKVRDDSLVLLLFMLLFVLFYFLLRTDSNRVRKST
jgi:UDP-GlcNAc:undecaprenyl-phosphate GlcNAc-1-phosphate transferase